MKLYHGTSEKHWSLIKDQGLLPRGDANTSNWTSTIESNPSAVYLSTGYALYFALNAMNFDSGSPGRAVVIEVDTEALSPNSLVPDEDALEQASRGEAPISKELMVSRTRKFRDDVLYWSSQGFDWQWSLDILGTCGHLGAITPDKFSRVAFVDIRSEQAITWVMLDVMVSVSNHRFLKHRNENIHRALFGDPLIQSGDLFLSVPPVGQGVQILNLKEASHV